MSPSVRGRARAAPARLAPPLGALLVVAALMAVALPGTSIIVDAATVQGTVRGTDGSPIMGARVEVVGRPDLNATSGPDGLYSLSVGSDPTGLTLRFTAEDRVPVELPTGPLPPLSVALVNATLRMQPPSAVLHIAILPAEMVGAYGLRQDHIYVTNASGTPAFERDVNAQEADVTVPAPGSYSIRGTRPGYFELTVAVTVGRGDDLDVAIDLSSRKKPTYGVIAGNVTHDGAALSNATVAAVPDDGGRAYEATTGPTGGYVLQVPPGNYSVRAEKEGYARISRAARVEAGGSYPVDISLPVAEETRGLLGSTLALVVLVVVVLALGAVAAFALLVQRRARAAREAGRARDATLECPSCGASAPEDADACPACGAVFPWRSFRCPECGTPLPLDAKRCTECGNTRFDLHRG